ncbi:DUF2249 domain-containing protein [Natrarchaeobius chitinivorans]|uniref:DUF2249 domain-containing protein n=1 Tax=Natrarchaeobius chitinivorans TaxID=1679083 RepID=A0A3N6PF30_NATCH|nr:DUF2249 domain-containing protein [Natrarchaeobius chitinivorans]RQG96055.1 DUF2249 domain-containing protein [Natrarchaeobius chitinivorans]
MATDIADQTLDVRKIDGPPFDDIVSALEDLETDERLRLIAPFEPAPLYEVLDARGFSHEAENRDGVWYVHIVHDEGSASV